MAVCQATEMSAVPASSLASQLPQVFVVYLDFADTEDTVVGTEICHQLGSPVGASLLAMAPVEAPQDQGDHSSGPMTWR